MWIVVLVLTTCVTIQEIMGSILHFLVLINVYCLVLISSDVMAMSEEQKGKVHELFAQVGHQCIADNPITEDEINKMKTKQMITSEDTQCFVACMLKKIGLMDDNGMLQKESAMDKAKAVFEDEIELKALGDYLHSCSSINSEAVGDGNKGCERAGKAYKCMIENASQFGFDL